MANLSKTPELAKGEIPPQHELEHQLGVSLLQLYSQSIFGKTAKAEIDNRIFAAQVRIAFLREDNLWEGGRFQWLRVEPVHLRKLSLKFRITESRVASLLEQSALAEGAEELSPQAAISEIKRLAERYRQDRSDLLEGRLRLFIPNRFTRRAIEAFLSANGAIPETSYHRDHLVIRLGDFIMAACDSAEEDVTQYLKKLAKRIDKEQGNKSNEEIETLLNATSIIDRAKAMGTYLTKKIADEATSKGIEKLFELMDFSSLISAI